MRFEPTGVALLPAEPRSELSFAPGLYVHVPFCSAICPYCDFAVVRDSPAGRSTWLDALRIEAECWRLSDPESERTTFDTVYLGGGTPSALEPAQLATLVEALVASLPIAPDAWWSLEVNPEDVDHSRASCWRELGFDFVSVGAQAIDDETLRRLGRRHDRRQALGAIETILEEDFGCVSIDLIYGLAGQRGAQWQSTLDAVAALGPDHLSCYELTFHEGTPFGRALQQGRMKTMAEEERGELFRLTHRHLDALGYEGYEVSNFARDGARSRHNQKYWHHVPYLGLGPSAHSFDGARRFWNVRELAKWSSRVRSAGSGSADEEALTLDQLRLEALMTGLRCIEGLSLTELEQRFGCNVDRLSSTRARLYDSGLLTDDSIRIEPTLDGRAVAESIALDLWQALEE